MGPLCQCPNMRTSGLNGHRESGTERERRVGGTRSRVEEVSLAKRDTSRGGSDLPNRAGQVIGWVRNGTSRRTRGRGAETRVEEA